MVGVPMARIGHFILLGVVLASPGASQQFQLTQPARGQPLNKAGDDPAALLAMLPQAGPEQAKEIRLVVNNTLKELCAKASPGERQMLAQQLAKQIPMVLHTAEEVLEVFGANRKISRQLLHRRYLEQWVYQDPLPLTITFEFPKGQPPRLFSVHPEKLTLP